MNIITDNSIDEDEAKKFLKAENGLDLLPGIPMEFGISEAAEILSVSEPTIVRMLNDGQIQLNKTAIQNYISQNYLVNRPIPLSQNTPKHPE